MFGQIRNKWVAAGIPVILGEYGVARRSALNDASRQFYLEFVNRTATTNGIKTFYWDNGATSGASDVFALFNRSTGAIVDANGLNAIMRGVGGTSTTFALAVTKSGTGTGTVTSSPPGINCGSTCNASYNSGTSVTLTAAAASGSTFGSWGGACSGTATSCTVSMTAARNVTATFNSSSASFTLSVTKAGSGTGTVTSNTGNINCGSTCSAQLRQRHVRDSDRGSRQRRELRGLERRVFGHRRLHGVDDSGACGDGDVQHCVHLRSRRYARGHRYRHGDLEPQRHQLRHLVHG